MTTLYRSPNVTVDAVEWHMTVEQHNGGKPRLYYRWRSAASPIWQPIYAWSGRLPKRLHQRFATYRKSIRSAVVGAGGEMPLAGQMSTFTRRRLAARLERVAA